MIGEQDVEKAVHWLVDHAEAAAEARAHREYLEVFSKSLLAGIMAEHAGKPVNVREMEARNDPRFLTHLEGYREAVIRDERYRWLRGAAETKISVWQTQQRGARP